MTNSNSTDTLKPGEKGDQYPTSPEAISFALGELTGRVNNLRDDIKEWKEGLKGTQADHEARLRAVEKWVWKATGMATAASFAATKLIDWISKHV